MEKTANIRMQEEQITVRNFYIRDIIVRAMAESGFEVDVNQKKDSEGRIVAEVLTIYKVEKIVLDDKRSGRSY